MVCIKTHWNFPWGEKRKLAILFKGKKNRIKWIQILGKICSNFIDGITWLMNREFISKSYDMCHTSLIQPHTDMHLLPKCNCFISYFISIACWEAFEGNIEAYWSSWCCHNLLVILLNLFLSFFPLLLSVLKMQNLKYTNCVKKLFRKVQYEETKYSNNQSHKKVLPSDDWSYFCREKLIFIKTH